MTIETKNKGRQTEGVATLLGDPKKAVRKLSIPMIIAMSVQTLYNVVDAMWIAGRGPESLSAVSFFFPFTMIVLAISAGLGIGGGAVISRMIGARDSRRADSAAIHSLLLMVILSILIITPCMIFARPIFVFMGAGPALGKALIYARILFAGTILFLFSQVGTAILRSEGDAKRVMFSIILGSVLNFILAPFFIYKFVIPVPGGGSFSIGLDLDVAGAGYAALISVGVSCLLLAYWMFMKKNTYLSFSLKNFKFDSAILKNIFKIGFPTALMQLSMSFMILFVTKIISVIGGDDMVAVFSTGWRIVLLSILPILGIGTAVTAVGAAAFGAREYGKLSVVYNYALRLGIIIEAGFSFVTFVFAPWITKIFTWSPDTARLVGSINVMLRYMALFYPAIAGGMVASSLFQGLEKGINSLIITFLRTLVIAVPLAALFGLTFSFGMDGVYVGIVIGCWISSVIAMIWIKLHIRKLQRLSPIPVIETATNIEVEVEI
jgi:putative MATE family efflux protein